MFKMNVELTEVEIKEVFNWIFENEALTNTVHVKYKIFASQQDLKLK